MSSSRPIIKDYRGAGPPPDNGTLLEWVEAYQSGDEAALNEIVTSTRRFIYDIAVPFSSVWGGDVPLEDLLQVGTMGMLRACKKFNLNHANRSFLAYAKQCVKSAVMAEVKKEDEEYHDFETPLSRRCDEEFIADPRPAFPHIAEWMLDMVLEPREAQVISYRFWDRYSYRQTARLMGCNDKTAKAIEQRALATLKQALQGESSLIRTPQK